MKGGDFIKSGNITESKIKYIGIKHTRVQQLCYMWRQKSNFLLRVYKTEEWSNEVWNESPNKRSEIKIILFHFAISLFIFLGKRQVQLNENGFTLTWELCTVCVYRGVGKCVSEKPLKVVNQIYKEGGGDEEELPIPDMVVYH